MENTKNVQRIEQIKRQMQVGDLLTASKMLGITTDAARMRLNRGHISMIEAMEKIIATRVRLIYNYNE